MPGFLVRIYVFKALEGFVLIYPLYAVMFVDWGLTPSQISAVLIAWSVAGLVLQIPAGVLADRLPRRWILAAGQAIRGLGFVCWFLFPGFPGALAGLTLWGVKSAMTNGIFEALVYDELAAVGRQQDYARVIGRAHGVSFAAVLAAALGSAATVGFGYPVQLLASIAAAAASTAWSLALPQAARVLSTGANRLALLRGGFGLALKSPVVPAIVAFAALSHAFGGGMEAFWPIFASGAGLPPAAVPIFVAVLCLAQGAGSTQAHRFARAPAAAFHALFGALGLALALAAAIYRPWTVGLLVAIAGLFKVIDVGFDARLHAEIPTEVRATLASVKTFCGLFAMTVMLAAFGPLAQALSYRTAFIGVGAAILGISLICLAAGALRRPGTTRT